MKNFFSILFVLLAFVTLIGLGSWQVQRLGWKSEIIRKLDQEYAKDAKKTFYRFEDLQSTDDLPILYGSIRGRFDYDKEILVGPKPLNGDIGYLVITPMALSGGGYVLVNRGWISQDNKDDINKTHKKGNMVATGIFRKSDWNRFTPNNSPENNIWTKLDITEIAAEKKIKSISPLMLYAQASEEAADILIPENEKWYPRNKHKQYAVFWFTMAGVLVVLFGLIRRKKKKSS
ncbi:MAG TPA: SURF1 family protein [Alphaproteobacteria bacterium]|nr:SURF1 family protein [Alphaproteobacteria bacterium]